MERIDDYLAKLNIEGERKVWLGNHPKIEYVFNQSKKYLKPGMTVCEVGVGDGHLLRLASRSGFKVTGIDISGYLVQKLAKFFQGEGIEVSLLQHDISQPIDDFENSFGAIFALDLLEHVEALQKAIENIVKLLKQNGLLIATLPWKENFADNMVICPFCHRSFHRVGHAHSFHSYHEITEMLGQSFQIADFGFIPPQGLKNKGVDILKKTIFRRKYYKDGLPNFQTTCFFTARCSKRVNGR